MTVLLIRNVEVEGRAGLDVAVDNGRITAMGTRLTLKGDDLDGRGGALIPGLADHHIHLLATAALDQSCVLDNVAAMSELEVQIVRTLRTRAPGAWLRATGLAPHLAEKLSTEELSRWAPDHPVRVQDQSGGLWVLNARALDLVGSDDLAEGVEKDPSGRLTGRLWRADSWLRARLGPAAAPALAPLGRRLAAAGITALTDASATTDESAAKLLADAVRLGDLPQRLTVMSAMPLAPPADGAFDVGPVKLLLDDRDLPALEEVAGTIEGARRQRRNLAVHCVTAAELAVTLAAFEMAGARYGDRIEHGGIIPEDTIGRLRALRLTVVTQPAFIAVRGDRYLRDVEPREHPDLYRCGSLIAQGVPTASSSDAPYGPADPWLAIDAATRRHTGAGQSLGPDERIAAADALRLYLGRPADPGGPLRRVEVGEPADLCLLKLPLADVLAQPSAALVGATIIGGKVIYRAGG